MRILHTSDWHVGRNLHGISLAHAHEAYFDHLVELVRSESLDAVLVSGDIYDRAIPPLESVELLSDALGRLCSLTRVVLTSGNHDSATRLGFGAGLLRPELAICSDAARVGEAVELPDRAGDVGAIVYALPYLDPDLTRHRLADGADVPERSHQGVLGAAVRRVEADLSRRRSSPSVRIPAVGMAHAFVRGGEPSDSERDLRVGGIGDVPVGLFGAELDYLALGHLHGPQAVTGGVAARYSGSPVAFSFSERNHTKSSVIVELAPDSAPQVQVVEAPVVRRLVEITGPLEDLLSGKHEGAADAWVKAVVTDTHRPEGMRELLLEHFPHAIVTLHVPGQALEEVRGVQTEGVDPYEVLESFVEEATGTVPSPDEVTVLRDAYESARGVVA
ncbi:MAG: exonuclease SbcCD subunit D C-terminal domain-containing protein [bacterium]|nr:exonuclease SbcCD subunit D C-terminal domain-containing protein [bacterium]